MADTDCTGQMGVSTGPCPTTPTIDISTVPRTMGMPTYTPAPDQLPLALDGTANILWVYAGEPLMEWTPLTFT